MNRMTGTTENINFPHYVPDGKLHVMQLMRKIKHLSLSGQFLVFLFVLLGLYLHLGQ